MAKRKKGKGILIQKKDHEVRIYFDPKEYGPTLEQLENAANASLYTASGTGCELSRFRGGEVRLYFNPLIHTEEDRDTATDNIVDAIRRAARTAVTPQWLDEAHEKLSATTDVRERPESTCQWLQGGETV